MEIESLPLLKAKVKETIPHVTTSFCSFKNFELDVRLKDILLFSCGIINDSLYYS